MQSSFRARSRGLKRQRWPEREMLEGPKSVRSKITTLLSYITCMCMAEMPMLRCS